LLNLPTDCLKAYPQHIHSNQSEKYAQDNHLETGMHSANNRDAVDHSVTAEPCYTLCWIQPTTCLYSKTK